MAENILTNFQYSRQQQRFSTITGATPTIPVLTGATQTGYTETDNMVLGNFSDMDLLDGEFFINTADDRVYIRSDDRILEFIISSGSTLDNINTTGATWNDVTNVILFSKNNGDQYSVTVDTFSGLTVNDRFTYVDGTQGAAKVLTSDASGNASWENPTIVGNLIYYFKNTATNIPTYLTASEFLQTGPLQTISNTGVINNQLLATFATVSGGTGINLFPAGIVTLYINAANINSGKQTELYCEVYKRTTGGTETILGTSTLTGTLNNIESQQQAELSISATTASVTDRIVVKIYATVTGGGVAPNVDLYVEDGTISRISLPSLGANNSIFVPYNDAIDNLDLGTYSVNAGNILSGGTNISTLFSPILTDGNGTTANGSAVDLGGTLIGSTVISGGTQTLVLGAGSVGGNLSNLQINSQAAFISALTTYDGTGVGTRLDITPGGFGATNSVNPVATGQVTAGPSGSQLNYYTNRIIKMVITGGIGTGETFTLNGTTFTEGIDGFDIFNFSSATIAGLNYSGVTDFVSATDNGDGVTFVFGVPVTNISETLSGAYFAEKSAISIVESIGIGVQLIVGDAFNPTKLLLGSDGINTFTDANATTSGIQYAADYSTGYTSLSLITKGDLDNAITATTDGNGTTANGSAVDLGGILSQNTTISGDSKNFTLGTNTNTLGSYSVWAATDFSLSTKFGAFQSNIVAVFDTATISGTDGVGTSQMRVSSSEARITSPSVYFSMSNAGGNTFTDLRTGATQNGIEYAADYSANYTPLSLITKGDLDGAISSFTPLTGGTTDFLGRWTSPTTLGIGATRDNGTSVGIGTSPSPVHGLVIGDNYPNGIALSVNQSNSGVAYGITASIGAITTGSTAYVAGINGTSQNGGASTVLVGVEGGGATSIGTNDAGCTAIGVKGTVGYNFNNTGDTTAFYGFAEFVHANNTYGLILDIENTGTGESYIGRFDDNRTPGVGKVLTCIDANGTAEWAYPSGSSVTNKYVVTTGFTSFIPLNINHNLNTATPIVQVIDSTGKLVIPESVSAYTLNSVTVTVSPSATYTIIVDGGGSSSGDLQSQYDTARHTSGTGYTFSTNNLVTVAANASVTVTLPGSPVTNKFYIVKSRQDASLYPITIDGNGNNIDGNASLLINTNNNASYLFLYDGTEWLII